MKDDDVVYIKLVNGEELFAHLVGEEDGKLLLTEPMIMETVQTEGETKYLFMARYTQYSEVYSMSLDKKLVVFIHDASPTVKNHYLVSVQFAKQINDTRFKDGITDATRYLNSILKNEDKKNKIPTELLGSFESDSSTKH